MENKYISIEDLEKLAKEGQLEQFDENSPKDLKFLILEYVSEKLELQDLTLDAVIDVMAAEFPEVLASIAEENFLRGYRQAFEDDFSLLQEEKENEELYSRTNENDDS